MSFEAELIRVASRLFIRPGNHADVPIALRRARMAQYEGRVPQPPGGTRTITQELGGVRAMRTARTHIPPGRHILFLHGGAYSTGSPALYRHIAWRFADAARAEFVALDYRLAPEHPYPAALVDARAAWAALVREGADPRRCAFLGDSAGGGLALALALRLRDEGEPLPAALVAISPWTDLAITGASARPGARDPMLKAEDLQFLADQYVGAHNPRDPYISPLYGDPRGLPPTLLQVGSDEILRDDSVRFAERMLEAGCDVTLEIWPRMPHVWHAFAPVMPEARDAIARIGAFVARATD
jgi:epsilon-lactone hydrolase